MAKLTEIHYLHETFRNDLNEIGKLAGIEAVRFDSNSNFEIEFDVNDWIREEVWDLEFKTLSENLVDIDEKSRGTNIKVKQLNQDVSNQFDDEIFITS